jgi:hypothetical protein
MIDMNKRRVFRETGTGDMATLAAENPWPAFGLGQDFLLISFIAEASGGSGGSAQHLDLYEKIAARPDGGYDIKRRRLTDFRTAGNPFYDWRLNRDDDRHWIQAGGDLWVPVWTNPDPGNMTWKLRVELVPWE